MEFSSFTTAGVRGSSAVFRGWAEASWRQSKRDTNGRLGLARGGEALRAQGRTRGIVV